MEDFGFNFREKIRAGMEEVDTNFAAKDCRNKDFCSMRSPEACGNSYICTLCKVRNK